MPLAIVAGDLRTGQEVVFRSGLVWPAVLAALSIPGFHPAQEMGPYLLVDGGIVNPRPSSVAADLGADVILALSPPGGDRPGRVEASSTEAVSSGQSSLEVVLRSLEIMQSRLSAEPANRVVLPLEIPVRDLALPAGISGSRERELVRVGRGVGEQGG